MIHGLTFHVSGGPIKFPRKIKMLLVFNVFPSKKQKLQLLTCLPLLPLPPRSLTPHLSSVNLGFLLRMAPWTAQSAASSNLLTFKIFKWQLLPEGKRNGSNRNPFAGALPVDHCSWAIGVCTEKQACVQTAHTVHVAITHASRAHSSPAPPLTPPAAGRAKSEAPVSRAQVLLPLSSKS